MVQDLVQDVFEELDGCGLYSLLKPKARVVSAIVVCYCQL